MTTASERERQANVRRVRAYTDARNAMSRALDEGNTYEDLLAALHAVLHEMPGR